MAINGRSNSGYIISGDAGLIDVTADPIIGKQGIHTYNDTRVYEKNEIWSVPPGLNPLFHTSGTASGVQINKDMQTNIGSHSFPFHASSTGSKSGQYFSDWGNDIWDSWGYWGLTYTSLVNSSNVDHERVRFGTVNQADGVFGSNTWTAGDGTSWTVKHGYPVANMWMMRVKANTPNQTFRISMGGNMGSDGNTYYRDGYTDVTLSTGQSMRLHWRENSDNSSFYSSEQVRWYYIPTGSANEYGTGTSTTRWYSAYVTGDNHYHYSNWNTKGSFTLYMAKGNNSASTSAWVGNDLSLV